MSNPVAQFLRALATQGPITESLASDAFEAVMHGEASPAQMAAMLMGLRVRGELAAEVAGAASAMRRAMRRLEVPDPSSIVDTCGTGGGTIGTFNISTAAALVAAGAGVRVAKHGNRSFTSACGSADVLEALGVAIDLPVDRLGEVLEDAGIVFMYAPTMHPAMRHVGPVRRELGIPTVMNILGPLANPAGAGRQVIGVADAARVPLMAGALQRLGTEHALVVHGSPGIDEISPLGITTVLEIRGGTQQAWEIDPVAFGMDRGTPEELAGGDPALNAVRIEEILHNEGPATARNAVVLNAAGALYVGGVAPSYAEAVTCAASALASGAGAQTLARLRGATQSRAARS